MSTVVRGMLVFGFAALFAGAIAARRRLRQAHGATRLLVFGPVFEAIALAMFAAEHFFAARGLMAIVPRWIPWPLFWTYFVGAALLAAAVSFLVWRCVRLSAALLGTLFLIIVATVDLPGLTSHAQDRFFWILTLRESAFAGGALALAASLSARGRVLAVAARMFVGGVMVFYAVQDFLHPLHVPGVPLENLIPGWWPVPALLSVSVGTVLLLCGVGLFFPRLSGASAALAGGVLLALTAGFYVPIFLKEMYTPAGIEGANYIGDTLLFAATLLLAGFNAQSLQISSSRS